MAVVADEQWEKLGKLLIARRVELGFPRRAAFVRHHGLSQGQQRTIEDIENGRRSNYEEATRAYVERLYDWETGSIDRVLRGEAPVAAASSREAAAASQSSGFVARIPPAVDMLPEDVQAHLLEGIWLAIRSHLGASQPQATPESDQERGRQLEALLAEIDAAQGLASSQRNRIKRWTRDLIDP